jgi:hypothetical protein
MPIIPRLRPSIFDLVFVFWVTAIPVALGDRLLNSDGDLPRHLRLGGWMLQHGALLTTDTFSYTLAGRPFLPFEWLSEVLYAGAHRLAGLGGVAVLAGLVLAATYALVARFLLRRGVEPMLAYLTAIASSLLGAAHWLARPHLFTMLLTIVLLALLERRDRKSLVWYLPLFSLWANLHGGFLYGLVLIGLYLVGDLIEWRLGGGWEWRERARHHSLGLLLAAVGTCLNANGFRLFTHVAGFFGQPLIMKTTQEFQSPDFHEVNGRFFLVALLLLLTGLALSRRRPSAPHLLVTLVNVAFALQSQRNMELFALTALPLMAWHLDADWRRLPGLKRPRKAFAQEAEAQRRGVPSAIFAVEMIVLALVGGSIAGVQILPDRFDEKVFPVRALERARQAGLGGRLFTQFTWGGYVLYAWPEQRVFIDGGTDHYGERLLLEYVRVWGLEPGWDRLLEEHRASLMVLPPESSLAYALSHRPEWRRWYCDDTAVILLGPGAPKPVAEAGEPAACPEPVGAVDQHAWAGRN